MIIWHILIALEWNIFQEKLKNSPKINILQEIFTEYKHTIQQCVDIFVWDLFYTNTQNFVRLYQFISYQHVEHLFILASTFAGSVSISAFASVAGISMGITNFAVGLKISRISDGIRNV